MGFANLQKNFQVLLDADTRRQLAEGGRSLTSAGCIAPSTTLDLIDMYDPRSRGPGFQSVQANVPLLRNENDLIQRKLDVHNNPSLAQI